MGEQRTDGAEDWWDALYDEPPAPPRIGNRLPAWWSRKPSLSALGTPVAPAEAAEPAGGDEDDVPTTKPGPEQTAEVDDAPRAQWLRPAPDYYPHPHAPALPVDRARIALSPKTRSGLYNAAAAGTGWSLGLLDLLRSWIAECGSEFSVGGALVLGIGGSLALAHYWDRRTRHWWVGLAWAARIPLATTVLAVALYAPASQL